MYGVSASHCRCSMIAVKARVATRVAALRCCDGHYIMELAWTQWLSPSPSPCFQLCQRPSAIRGLRGPSVVDAGPRRG